MTNGNLVRLPIGERTTTTILRQEHSITATAGNVETTTAVGPASGKRWLVTSAIVSGRFSDNPDANDAGSCEGSIVNGGNSFVLAGVSMLPDSEEAIQFGSGGGGQVTLEFGDEVELIVDATDSVDVDIAGVLTFWGFEYDDNI